MHTAATAVTQLDLRGLKCPLPALRTRKALRRLAAGGLLRVECTDPMSVIDIPHAVRVDGHVVIEQLCGDGVFVFVIGKHEP